MSTAAQVKERDAVPRYTEAQIEQMDTDELLAAYKTTGCAELKWPLVLRYRGLVKSIALQIRGIYSNFTQVDDIIDEGVIALMDAVDKFDPDKGIKFETYVAKRIRGMIIDLARRQDWTPRSVRRRSREIDQAAGELYTMLGRFPTDAEIASRLGISETKYQEDLVNISLCNVMSLEALFDEQPQNGTPAGLAGSDAAQQPEQMLQEQELHQTLAAAIGSLRENEQMVLAFYYQENLNMKEIAHVMGISQPRVSQIHTKAIQKLRLYMEQYLNNG